MTPEEMRERMVSEWGLASLSPEEQDSTINRIGALVYKSVILRAEGEMSEQDKEALDLFLNGEPASDAPQVLDFLRGRLSNFDQLFTEEVAELKSLIAPASAA